MPNLLVLFSQIAVIVLASRLAGVVFRKLGQPQVVGEMVSGILLGPSLLGWLFPGVYGALFPAFSLGFLNALSQLGLMLYMFMVGMDLNTKELRQHGHAAMLISHVSIIVPFVFGALLSIYLYPRLSDDSVSFLAFALFTGAAIAITAFPVLARILADRDLLHTRMGTMAIASAAVDDVTGWCILAYIIIMVHASAVASPLWITVTGLGILMAIMFWPVRRLLQVVERHYIAHGNLSDQMMALVLLVLLGSALATEVLGLHLLFGAFVAGAVMPKDAKLRSCLAQKLESVTMILLLPLFFAIAGLRTRLGMLIGAEMWFACALVTVVAVAAKLGGTSIAARLGGLDWRDSVAIGVLMNTRGLMELVILNIGLEIKVISPALFSMMVIMALVTTFMTTPLLKLVRSSRFPRGAPQYAPCHAGIRSPRWFLSRQR
jgi:Kef-type K+ transport system membrane component KefB